MNSLAPSLQYTPEALRTTEIDFSYTFAVLQETIGTGLLDDTALIDVPTLEHQLGVGQLMAEFLEELDFDEPARREVALAGGAHDFGKTDKWVQEKIHKPIAYDAETRQQIRDKHCALGEAMLNLVAISALPEQQPVIERMAFVARHHHTRVPQGYYPWRAKEESQRWGLTHLTQYADVLHALWYDHTRTYVRNREKALADRKPPKVVFDIIMKETGGANPIFLDAEINIRPLLAGRLGLKLADVS